MRIPSNKSSERALYAHYITQQLKKKKKNCACVQIHMDLTVWRLDENKEICDLWPCVIFLKWPLDVWKCCSVPWGERGLHAVWTCWDAFTAERERERAQSRHGKMLYFWEPEQERKFEYTKLRYFYEKYQLIRENLIILFDRYYKPQIGWQQMYIYYIPAIYRQAVWRTICWTLLNKSIQFFKP